MAGEGADPRSSRPVHCHACGSKYLGRVATACAVCELYGFVTVDGQECAATAGQLEEARKALFG